MGVLKKKSITQQQGELVRLFPTKSIFDAFLGGGIPSGITLLAGAPASGKSSFALQMASLLTKHYNFDTIYLDSEKSLTKERIESLFTYYTDKVDNLERVAEPTIEDLAKELVDRLNIIYQLHLKSKSDLITFVSNNFDQYKAVFIWDSIASIISKSVQAKLGDKLKTGDALNKMTIGETARILSTIFTNVILPYSDYAIPFLVITHMKQKIDLNPYSSNDFELKGLEGKVLKGGWTPLYLAHNIIILNAKKKIDDENVWVEFKIVKSRITSPKKFRVVFNYKWGYREDINLFYLLKEYKYIRSKGGFYQIGDDTKNYRKDTIIKKIAEEIDKYREIFYKEILPKEQNIEIKETKTPDILMDIE